MAQVLDAIAHSAVRAGLRTLSSLGRRHVVITLDCGFKLRLRTNDLLGYRLVREQQFEPSVRQAIRTIIKPGMTALDIGANLGYYSLELSRLVGSTGTVVAFEPQITMMAELKANLELNAVRNVITCPIALSDEGGDRTFFVPPPGHESMGSLKNNGRTSMPLTTKVPCSTLDEAVQALKIDRIDFIKMDVEGAELQVLQGARTLLTGSKRPTVVFEAYEANCAPFRYCVFDLLKRFDQIGYKLMQLDECDWCASPC